MGDQQAPTAVQTDLPQGMEHGQPAVLAEQIRRLNHNLDSFRWEPLWTGFQQSVSGQIVAPIERTRLLPMQMHAVRGKGDEVPQAIL